MGCTPAFAGLEGTRKTSMAEFGYGALNWASSRGKANGNRARERLTSPNWKATAPSVEGIFFPHRQALGLDARQLTPTLLLKITITAEDSASPTAPDDWRPQRLLRTVL